MMERNILSVANVNAYIKQVMDKDYILKNLWVQGEVSNFKAHSSGHLYFTLKDAKSNISCIMFKSNVESIDFQMNNGIKIIVSGSVSVYERSGQYQIYVRRIIEDGLGKLYKTYEKLKNDLEKEGLFDSFFKKPLPKYVQNVGIVTSKTGAAIQDIINVAKRRNPYVQLTLYPSLVQGEGAADNIIEGIEFFDKKQEVDVIIIGRGGGSIEDLWPFNEERVARAIYEASIPIISGVGHETDFTIADFVADYRAPTPSAASEVAVFDYDNFIIALTGYKKRLEREISSDIEKAKQRLELGKVELNHAHPMKKYERKYQLIEDFEDRLNIAIKQLILKQRNKLLLIEEQLEGKSPLKRLKEGYGYISDLNMNKIISVSQLDKMDSFMVTLSDGQVVGKVQEIVKEMK